MYRRIGEFHSWGEGLSEVRWREGEGVGIATRVFAKISLAFCNPNRYSKWYVDVLYDEILCACEEALLDAKQTDVRPKGH
jgi:hypothetical protein